MAKRIPTNRPPAVPPTWLPAARIVAVPGRGEVFCRTHERPEGGPTLLLLHGWTASADVQFATIYQALMARYSFVAVDHRGHGRGIRSDQPFRLRIHDPSFLNLETAPALPFLSIVSPNS